MPTLKNHPLVSTDFQAAYSGYEDQLAGLGHEFAGEFRRAYHQLRQNPLRYSIRFFGIRRLNLKRFPYGIFYILTRDEVRVLAVLHGSRETKRLLRQRRRTFPVAGG